ncbi:hypothetical protein [Paludibacter sp.]|uniref:hypothetical protein n=1 Tax=Paludibacter sp. TaxID=1898105 RepID=UPI00135426BE|nr:hypothetical protein [Paludibacter sp.]MTK52942.1 hypothetical protein [Paludibacter sp.]
MKPVSNEFGEWIKGQRFTVFLAIFCAILPLLINPFVRLLGTPHFLSIIAKDDYLGMYIYDICNIMFIVAGLLVVTSSNFLLNSKDYDKAERLTRYVQDKFGSGSSLYLEGREALYQRMSKGCKQFYYSWVVVWIVWLILYIGKLIFIIRMDHFSYSPGLNSIDLYKIQGLFENICNLINSGAFFFIYLVITISTVKQAVPNHSLKEMHRYIIILLFLGLVCILFDFNALFVDGSKSYYLWELVIQLIISLIASISMIAVVGRLNSSFMDIPQWMILSLYLYAALQMFYPLGLLNQYVSNEMVDDSSVVALQSALDIIYKGFYFCAFLGKICMLLTIKWIMSNNRFLFYSTHIAQVLAESEDMMKEFNRYYERSR